MSDPFVLLQATILQSYFVAIGGMVERFNGRISQLLTQTQFTSSEHLKSKLKEYLMMYNHHIVQKNIGHVSPIAKLKEWQKTNPELFVKKVYNQSRPDSYRKSSITI